MFHASADGRGFAVSGGVAEAVVHAVKRIDPDREVKVMNAEGLQNCKKMLQMAKIGKYNGYLLEGMACPGGCINGGGQPYKEDAVMVEERRHVLYGLDKRDNLRFSHENPSVKQCYEEYFEKPLSHRAHEILHV